MTAVGTYIYHLLRPDVVNFNRWQLSLDHKEFTKKIWASNCRIIRISIFNLKKFNAGLVDLFRNFLLVSLLITTFFQTSCAEEVKSIMDDSSSNNRLSSSNRVPVVPVENIILKTQVETLQWQLKQVNTFLIYRTLEKLKIGAS